MNIGKIVLGALVAAAGMTVFADPSVTINKVETASPWVSGEGTITVDYSLSGLDSRCEYRVAFDITAKNETRGVTNDWAKLTEGRQDIKTIDTAALFGKEVVAAEAKVNISLIVEVLPAGRLWKDGPIWAERNLGASKVGDYGELYKYDDADAAVKDILGQEWRLPTKEELNELSKTCESKWDSARGGVTCRGSGKYEVNSIFLPAAGIDQGEGRSEAGSAGVLWSSTPCDVDQAYCLRFAGYIGIAAAEVDEFDRDFGMSVRAVRDGIEGDSEVREEIVATAEAKFWLGPGCESCPWTVGDGVTAYIKDRSLHLLGEGEVVEAPWAEYDESLDGIGPLSRAITIPASVAATLPISVAGVAAPSGVTVNGVDVRTGFSEDWTYDPKTHTVEIVKPGSYVLSGSNTEGKVMFAINADAEVTLSNLCLRCTTAKECCIRATNDVSVTLFLAGVNTLDAFDGNNEMGEGLRIENDSHLTIAAAPGFADEDAVLIAKGGYKHAAIAVRRHGTEGGRPSLAIAGGTVYANWFESPARRSTGIGANSDFLIGCNMNCDADIAITGGRVFARGGYHVPGIGGTHYLAFGAPDILITGGYVEAEGGEEASGIGGGYQGKCGSVTITGGTIRAKGQGTYADIGTHFDFVKDAAVTLTGGSIWMANRSHVEPWPPPSNGTERVWCATVQVNVEGGGKWEGPLAIDGLEGYGTKDIVAVQGEVYLWLSNGKHTFIVGGKGCTVDVNGKKTVPVSVSIPPVEPPPGTVDNPWIVGKDVQAYTNERGELTITGTGAMDDFATAADIPWVPAGVTEVTIGAGVTKIGANAWAGMNDSVVINGAALPVIRLTASGLDSAGSTLPEGMIAVSRTELEAAGAATLTIVDGTAYLGVSVKTNGDLKAERKSWGKVKFDKDVKVDVSEDGTELVIPVPANAEKGFMVLESGESK